MQSPTTRKKKTKLEKIAELETKCKALKEENRRLRGATASGTGTGGSGGGNSLAAKLAQTADDAWSETNNSSVSEWTESPSIASSIGGTVGGDTDKLKEALRALKRVTVKQEMTLATLRQKAKQRRNEIDEKDRIIQQLQEENEAYQKAHKDLTESNDGKSGGETINTLRLRLADVQILLAKEKKERQDKSVLLEESQKKVSSLRKELSSLSSSSKGESGGAGGGGSGKGQGSGDDYSRLKRELAKKTELIATLQHDLEVRKDEIHDLKQREVFHSSFQQSPFKQQSSVGTDDDFFDSDDDDFWT